MWIGLRLVVMIPALALGGCYEKISPQSDQAKHAWGECVGKQVNARVTINPYMASASAMSESLSSCQDLEASAKTLTANYPDAIQWEQVKRGVREEMLDRLRSVRGR